MKKSVALKIVIFAISAIFIFLAIVKFKYGTGKEYPDLGANLPPPKNVSKYLVWQQNLRCLSRACISRFQALVSFKKVARATALCLSYGMVICNSVSAFDLNTKKRVEFFEFPEGQASYAEDIRITADGKHIILPNPGLFSFTTPSIVVYSVLNHTFHSIKSDHPCLRSVSHHIFIYGDEIFSLAFSLALPSALYLSFYQ